MRRSGIFRSEAFEGSLNTRVGEILVLPSLSVSFLVYLFSSLVITIALFILSASYNKKETVVGVVVPEKGLVRVYPRLEGNVEEMFVEEGNFVEVGQDLAIIHNDLRLAEGVAINERKTEALKDTLKGVERLLSSLPEKKNLFAERIEESSSNLLKEKILLEKQSEILERRVKISRDNEKQVRHLKERGLVSGQFLAKQVHEALQMQQDLERINEAKLNNAHRLSRLSIDREELDIKFNEERVNLEKESTRLDQALADVAINASQKIVAPVAGRVAAIQFFSGHYVKKTRPFLTILPEGSQWVVHLYVPSRAIGGVSRGQKVTIRYGAFPHQKFGIYHGSIEKVGRSVIMPSELENQIDVRIQEAIYLVSVRLDQQFVSQGHQKFDLQSGMKVYADIILEDRKLWEWLVEPFTRYGK